MTQFFMPCHKLVIGHVIDRLKFADYVSIYCRYEPGGNIATKIGNILPETNLNANKTEPFFPPGMGYGRSKVFIKRKFNKICRELSFLRNTP